MGGGGCAGIIIWGVVTFYISEYGDVRASYDKVCFSASSNYMNSPSFHASHYFNSPLNLQFVEITQKY